MPERIQRKRTRGWSLRAVSPNAVIVDRSTIYGNPFRVGVPFCGPTIRTLHTPRECVDQFEAWIRLETLDPRFWDGELILAHVKLKAALDRGDLIGRDLACWCKSDQPCHADVLLKIANQPVGVSRPAEDDGSSLYQRWNDAADEGMSE